MMCGSFNKRLLEKETEDEKQELTPVQKELVEALVWFRTNCPVRESLKAKSSWTMASCSEHQFVNPLEGFVPKKRRGCGPQSGTDHEEAKSTVTATVDEFGFIVSKKTENTDQEDAKNSNSSVDELAKPFSILVPKKKNGMTGQKFVKKSHHYHISSYEDGLKLKTERQEEKQSAAGRKLIFKRQRVDNEDGQEGLGERPAKKRKKMERVDFKKLGLDPAPNFSSQIKARIDYQEGRDSEIKLRIMKQIFKTDMNTHHARFSMPLNQIKDLKDFLKENEIEGTEVMLVELGLKEDSVHQSTMGLRKWPINTNISYMLISKWSDVLRRNEGVLKENDIVQLYSFRRDGKLWFVLIKVMDADEVARRGASERSTAQGNNDDGLQKPGIEEII